MQFWKSQFTKQFHKELIASSWDGEAPAEPPHARLWQSRHWDRRLRSGESYGAKWDYVLNNPVRHGLVTDAADWPFQGELHQLRF